MANIYQFLSGYCELWDLIENEELPEDVILDAFENMTDDLADKLKNCCMYIKNQDATINGLADEIKRLQAKKKAAENGVDRLKALMFKVMETAGEKKMPAGTFTVSIQNNPPKVVLDASVADIPSEYLVPQPPEVDKKKLLADLKASDEPVPFAHIEQSASIRIR